MHPQPKTLLQLIVAFHISNFFTVAVTFFVLSGLFCHLMSSYLGEPCTIFMRLAGAGGAEMSGLRWMLHNPPKPCHIKSRWSKSHLDITVIIRGLRGNASTVVARWTAGQQVKLSILNLGLDSYQNSYY